MKKNTLILLVAVAAVAVVTAWLLRTNNQAQSSAKSSEARPLASFSLADATEVFVQGMGGSVTLALDSGKWVVRERGGFTADTGKLASLLRGISELKPIQTLDAPEAYYERLGLANPITPTPQGAQEAASTAPDDQKTGLLLRISDSSGKTLAEWIIGKPYYPETSSPLGSFQTGRYYRTVADKPVVILASDVAQGLTANPADWLEKELLLPGVEIVRIESHPASGADSAWVAASGGNTNDTTLALQGLKEGEEERPGAIASLVGQIQRLRFDDIQPASTDQEGTPEFQAAATARITSKDGTVFDLAFGAEANGMTPVKITRTPGKTSEGNPDTNTPVTDDTIYLVQTFALGQLLAPRSELLQPPPTPTPTPQGEEQTNE